MRTTREITDVIMKLSAIVNALRAEQKDNYSITRELKIDAYVNRAEALLWVVNMENNGFKIDGIGDE